MYERRKGITVTTLSYRYLFHRNTSIAPYNHPPPSLPHHLASSIPS